MADNTPLNDSCRTEGAPIAASTNPANKGLRTDGRVRFAPPPAAEAQAVGPTARRWHRLNTEHRADPRRFVRSEPLPGSGH